MPKVVGIYKDEYAMPEAIKNCFDSKRYDVSPFMFIEVSMIKAGYNPEYANLKFEKDDWWLVVCRDCDIDEVQEFIKKPELDPEFDLNIVGF